MLKSFYYNDSIAAPRWLDTLEAITIGWMANGSLLRVGGTEHIKPLVSGGKPDRNIPRTRCVQMSLYTSDIFSVKKHILRPNDGNMLAFKTLPPLSAGICLVFWMTRVIQAKEKKAQIISRAPRMVNY